MKVDRLLYAGNSLERARELFDDAVKHWPRIRLTGRQRTRVPAAVTCLRLVGPLRLIRRVRSDTFFRSFAAAPFVFFNPFLGADLTMGVRWRYPHSTLLGVCLA
jgi:hypothetical protein